MSEMAINGEECSGILTRGYDSGKLGTGEDTHGLEALIPLNFLTGIGSIQFLSRTCGAFSEITGD
jgi:hypothetical protein